MACAQCPEGYWVCEKGTPNCEFEPLSPPKAIYVGRFSVSAGSHKVWARGNNVSISDETPAGGTGGSWDLLGHIDTAESDYDIWLKPGNDAEVKIEEA